MKHSIYLATVAFAGLVTGSAALAQAPEYPPCFDANGYRVVYRPDPTINDVAISLIPPSGIPTVLWNPNVTSKLRRETVEFFYYHECAHHRLGHTLGAYPVGIEIAADCWAFNTMADAGKMPFRKYKVLIKDLRAYSKPGVDWNNGYQRVKFLAQC